MRPHHEEGKALSLRLDLYILFDIWRPSIILLSSPSEADRMAAEGACDGAGTTGPDYVSSGGFIGTGPDSVQQ